MFLEHLYFIPLKGRFQFNTVNTLYNKIQNEHANIKIIQIKLQNAKLIF